MSKKLAIMFPGIRYTCDRSLLYYSRKVLEKHGYDVICVNYDDLLEDPFIESFAAGAIINGAPANKASKEKLLSFVFKAKENIMKQLGNIDFANYDKIVFVEKSIGTVVGAILAAQTEIEPYHIMITPIDYAFSFVGKSNGSAFVGTEDSLCNFSGIKDLCKERGWNFNPFKGCNHSLEAGDVIADIDHLKRFASTVDTIALGLEKSIYEYEVLGRDGRLTSISKYKGNVLLIVNTATGCGFTPQYSVLEELYKKYQKAGLEILDFPCNQFANQAPGTNEEIYSFCSSRYEITFDQFAKIKVNGEGQSELFEYLKLCKGFKGFDSDTPDAKYLMNKLSQENPEYEMSSDIKWNFTKFLVSREGLVVDRFEPTDGFEKIEMEIEELLL